MDHYNFAEWRVSALEKVAKKIVSANHVKDLHEEFNHSIICENFKNSKDCKSVTELSASSRLAESF